ICYLFLANKYKQSGRPDDEHRFQIKYGSEFKRLHDLFIAPHGGQLTLMFGVHLEAGVIVAVDPAMHNPTWFSRSVEFKAEQIERIQQEGWIGWERDRSRARRHVMPQENCQTEVLLGLRPERFADYVLLERGSTGISPGERLLAIDKRSYHVDDMHALEMLLALPKQEILDAIKDRRRLLVAMRGAAAELHLLRVLKSERELSRVIEIDDDGQPDFEVEYRGRPFRIECKNTLRRERRGVPKVDFQKTRSSMSDPCSRYYKPEQFEILAACLHPVTDRWEFRFCPTRALPPHHKCPGHLSQHVFVDNGEWTTSVTEALALL
ncbi:MAG TPA: hypothetical protein PKD61_38040, partial [Polyangiaceae bacterium]|nr:hypothetical protein [Polyangiaceae bacterium]